MVNIHEINFSEVLPNLPDIEPLDKNDLNHEDTFFLCALGFEDRCLTIPKFIADRTEYKCKESIYFEYSTNIEDNEINRERLAKSLNRFSSLVTSMQCDSENFPEILRHTLTRLSIGEDMLNITFDISACSSKLLLTILKIIFEFDVRLQIVYTESKVYHPTKDEAKNIERWIREDVGLSVGVSDVFTTKEYSGGNVDDLPQALVSFLTFKPERIKKIISYVDETLLQDSKRNFLVVGEPHLSENRWRIDFVKKVNKEIINQLQTSPLYCLSTFDYKKTLKTLYEIYGSHSLRYHLNIAALGSKMQLVGMALFHHMKPDTTIIFASPQRYNAEQYSEGYYKMWKIDMAKVKDILNLLDSVGTITLNDFGEKNGNKQG